jgi:TonB family protein
MQHLAEQGDAEAQMDLGYLYEHGIGYPQDGAQAEAWYEKAAAQGLARADVCLAQMLLWSKLVPHDEPRAVELLKHADAAGDQYAAYYLGYLYRYGQGGLPKDLAQADRYTARAGTAMRDAYDSYFRVLHDLIAGNQHFPATAVAGHYGGLVKVLFSIDGPYARDAKVTQSSGHSELDDAAIAAVYQTYYPPLPPGALPPLYYAINIDFNTP